MGPAESEITRRALAVRSLGLAASAVAPAALAGAWAQPERAAAQTPDDFLLTGAIGLEQTLIALYGVALESGRLDNRRRALAGTLRDHARVHIEAISDSLSEFTAPPKPNGDVAIPGLGKIESAKGYLELALGFENQAYLAYLDAVGPLESATTRRLVASLAASSAQHLALLRSALGRQPVTGAFETGAGA